MRHRSILLALACLTLCAWQDHQPPSRGQVDLMLPRLLASDRATEALELIDAYLTAHPNDAQVLFDGARVASRLGDARSSAVYAIGALRAGWVDDKALDEHPDLTRLRAHEAWEQVRAVRHQLRDATKHDDQSQQSSAPLSKVAPNDVIARRSLQSWLDQFGGGRYRTEEHPPLNLLIASAIDPIGLHAALKSLELLSSTLTKDFFGELQPQTVLLVVATPTDADKFLSNPQHAGLYVHEARRLVTRNTGSTLRHEYTHLRHYGQMDRLGQRHPIWILEGLATLFEDWQIGPAGQLIILPNLRSSDAYDRVKKRKVVPWVDFIAMNETPFMAEPQWNYAQTRSMLMYFASEGKLISWYRLYTATWKDDPTGQRAMEQTFAAPIGRIEAQWKAWVLANGRQDSTIDSGDGVNGVNGVNGVMGMRVSNLPDGVRLDAVQVGGPAQRVGMRQGDVITEIGPQEIRCVGDYVLAMADRKSGENVKVRFRRGTLYSTVEVNLAAGHATQP